MKNGIGITASANLISGNATPQGASQKAALASPAESPGRQSHVNEQCVALSNNVGSLEIVVSQLLERISPILRSELVAGGASIPTNPEPYLVDLANDLRNRNYGLANLTARIEDALSRLEL